MFYVNNEQVKGIFLNGRNYNYLSYGFGKIIPEDRNSVQLSLNLAYKHLNQYRIEWGTVKDGYENALVSPRFDKPDNKGVFHTPFTYYHNGNIISTKQVPVLITDGNYALSNALVYNDMNIKGAINYFAINTDFQGHNVNTYSEEFGSSQSYFESIVMSNCSNFHLRSLSSFSKGYQPALYNCNNFSGWFNFVRGDDGTRYPGFRGFLEDCKDGVFNINCKNMHGGGSSANVTNYYNFSGIQSCNNIKLNIIGSSWQVWPHDHSFSRNCNINTYNVISGFSYMNDCNFNVVLPKDSKPEMTSGFAFLNNAENCNYNLYATDVNLFNYRSGVEHTNFFEDLNNCNLNLLLNNSTGLDYAFGNRLNNCNIQFNNMNFKQQGFGFMNNCTLTGKVSHANIWAALVYSSINVNLNINARNTSDMILVWNVDSVTGNVNLSNDTNIKDCSNSILNLYNGNISFNVVKDCKFTLNNVNNVNINGAYNTNFDLNRTNASFINVNNTYARVYNTTFNCHNTNNTEIDSDGGSTSITGLDNCYNLTLSGLTFNTTALGDSCLLENVYNSNIGFGTADTYYRLWRVENCDIDGFPRGFAYVNNCVFRPFSLRTVGLYGGVVGTWSNTWPHRTIAGIRGMDNITNCRINADVWNIDGSITFNNVNNMQTSFGSYYNGVVTANLPIYNMSIKLNVDCATLNLGMFQAGPPHGFQNATISANDIYAKGDMSGAYVQVNCDTKIYCENYCSVCFKPYISNSNSVLQPVILINNYDHYNSGTQSFFGGLTRIGSLSTRTGPRSLSLHAGACVFINNSVLDNILVDNALLFIGNNVSLIGDKSVTNGGLIVNRENWGSHSGEVWGYLGREHFCWNIWDSGPWGSSKLVDFCIWV